MMTQPVAQVRAGDPITAGGFNALVDVAQQGLRLLAAFPLVMERTPGGILLRLARQPSLKFALLAETVAPHETGKLGHVLDYDAAEPQWVDTTTSPGFSPQIITGITDPWDGGIFLAGERRVVYFDQESGQYLPLASPGPHLAITTEQISRGETGNVLVQQIDGAGELVETEIEVEVHNWLLPRIWSGVPCWMECHPQSRRWYLTRAYSATKLLATVNVSGGVSLSDASFDVDNVVALDGVYPETSISSVQNTFQHVLDDDALVALVWNDTAEVWETWQGTCPA